MSIRRDDDHHYRLTDGERRIDVKRSGGKVTVVHLQSDDIDFLDRLHRLAGSAPARWEALVLLDELGLRFTGDPKVTGVYRDEVTVVLRGDSILYVREPWSDEETRLFSKD